MIISAVFYKSLSYVTFKWSHRQGSNLRPADYKSAALPTELRGHIQALRTCYGNFVYCAGIYKNKKNKEVSMKMSMRTIKIQAH